MRSSEDIESAFKLKAETCEIFVCGKAYVVDLKNLVQYQKRNPILKRSIKRDKIENVDTKGIAGLK